jgi:L,D-transpeptidase ErfK/SrfK
MNTIKLQLDLFYIEENMKAKLGMAFFLLISTNVFSATFNLPPADQSLIGEIQYRHTDSDDTIVTLQKNYDLGFNAIEKANPQLNTAKSLHSGNTVKLPTQHLLPNMLREGIIVNLPEMRMYYFIPGTNKVATYPIGIGRIGKTIPLATAIITKKTENPSWVPTPDIREFNLTQGVVIPQIMPPGPDNPLGTYAIYMSVPTFLIHSTIFPESVGKRASFGCVRMFQDDIKDFFPSITPGIPVLIINSPVKVAWHLNHLMMESHPALEEHHDEYDATLPHTISEIHKLTQNQDTLVDWQAVDFIEQEKDGIPHEIGIKISA